MQSALLQKSILGRGLGGKQAAQPRASARFCVVAKVAGASNTPTWLPGADRPDHLKGEDLAGNRGFDPLGLGTDPSRLQWFAEAERTNARWAMAAVAGIMGQELLGVKPAWYLHGEKQYWLPISALVAIMFPVTGFFELKRYQGFQETGKSGFVNSFPFDPAGLDSDANREKEIKNGRLAMVAFVGFVVQALVTRSNGPIDDLTTHLSDPFGKNIISSIGNLPQALRR